MSEAIFAEVGERLTQALVTGEFELYRQALDLPIDLVPQSGPHRVLQTLEELEEDFRLNRQTIKLWGITDIYRKPLEIEELNTGDLAVTCEMHIMADARRLVAPFNSVMTLHETEEGWKFNRIHSSLGHLNWTLGQADISEDGTFRSK